MMQSLRFVLLRRSQDYHHHHHHLHLRFLGNVLDRFASKFNSSSSSLLSSSSWFRSSSSTLKSPHTRQAFSGIVSPPALNSHRNARSTLFPLPFFGSSLLLSFLPRSSRIACSITSTASFYTTTTTAAATATLLSARVSSTALPTFGRSIAASAATTTAQTTAKITTATFTPLTCPAAIAAIADEAGKTRSSSSSSSSSSLLAPYKRNYYCYHHNNDCKQRNYHHDQHQHRILIPHNKNFFRLYHRYCYSGGGEPNSRSIEGRTATATFSKNKNNSTTPNNQIDVNRREAAHYSTSTSVFSNNNHNNNNNANMPPVTASKSNESEDIDTIVSSANVVIFTMTECRFCTRAKAFLDEKRVPYREIVLDPESNGLRLYEALQAKLNRTSVPQIFVAGQPIGGCDDMLAKDAAGELMPLIRGHRFEYDLIVIGGGSGGLAASKEAASFGKKVALLDFVTPSPHGTTWGLGGTCVNVGCIPKKLMHHASLIGQEIEDAHHFGWVSKADGGPLTNHVRHDWPTLVDSVQRNVKSSNFGYRTLLRSENVEYLNAYGEMIDSNTVKLTGKAKNLPAQITAAHVIIATGERPRYPADVEGAAECAITSDDLFSLPHSPGKTLIIGASYVALECAGFLRGLGFDVTVMVRSIVLRGFDRQCSELVRKFMQEYEHVRFIDTSVPRKLVRVGDGEPGTVAVTYENTASKEQKTEQFNTVLFAIGRDPCTEGIGLPAAGVSRDKAGYVPVANGEQTNVPNIYAIGDIVQGKPQLTPVAIEAGILLARRLYAAGRVHCDYDNVPTTVFTPLEYGCCGLTEETAIERFGADGIEVYHQFFTPTEWRMNYYDRPRCPMNVCYVKVITTRSANGDPTEERLLGFHYVGPNAGEVSQFVAAPLKLKATKADLDAIIGIHPTCAELFTTLTITKRSGKEPTQKGCCG